MSDLQVGIIGTGGIADTAHAPAIKTVDNIDLGAVFSRDEEKGQAFLDKHGSSDNTVYTSLDDFIGDGSIDLVIICSPDKLHYKQALACLQAGKHVLLEKPMSTTEKEAEELVKVAEENNLILAVGFHLRSHNGHRILKQKIQSEKVIGEIRHIRIIWAFPMADDSNWRAKEELTKWWSLSAVGSHCIDLARWFAEDNNKWQQFSSVISNNTWNGPHDETAALVGELSSGATVEVTSSVKFGPYTRIELFGDKGTVICAETLGRHGEGTITINDKEMDFETQNPFVEQLKNIAGCIDTSSTPRADGSAGLRSVRDLLLAVQGKENE